MSRQARVNLIAVIDGAVEWLTARDIAIPDDLVAEIGALKVVHRRDRRDRREPGREEKERLEKKLVALIMRRFRKQRNMLVDALETRHPERKTADLDTLINPDDFWTDDEYEAELIDLLTQARLGGVALFGKRNPLQIDYTLTNAEAAEAARKYAYDLVKNIDDISREALQKAISTFVETPGFSIQDLVDLLPYGEVRALMIAVTEVTRAYASGQQDAGEALAKEFPDVPVKKIWFTNADDRVCPLCAPLDGEEIDLDENFYEPDEYNDGNPPAHVNCRCWMETSTAIE